MNVCDACNHQILNHATADEGYGPCEEPDCDCPGWDGYFDGEAA